jgi:hypothetical protein
MHRAGTSFLTKILNILNVHTGNDLDDNNESQFFYNLNEWMFFQAGATWDNPYNMLFINNGFIDDMADALHPHLESKSVKKYHPNFGSLYPSDSRWAWKDPRNTFTYPVWLKLFPGAKFIHIYRNPIDVAESLRKREEQFQKLRNTKTRTGIKKRLVEARLTKKRIFAQSLRINHIQEGVKLWEQYTSQALQVNENCFHLSYEELLDEPVAKTEKICDFLNIEKDSEVLKSIPKEFNTDRKNAFVENSDLTVEYRKIQTNELVLKLGYQNII